MTVFQESLRDQDDTRARLVAAMKQDPKPFREMAREIGIVPDTLRKFIILGKNLEHVAYYKIQNYLAQKGM